jgi:hypothetical protein
MTQTRLSALGLFLAVFLCLQTTLAQQTNPPDDARTAAEAALREKAFKLLDSLADQLGSLQSAENRARVGSNIAESIWSHDEERARNLFRLAAEDIKLGLQQTKDDGNREQTFAVFQKLREDNVERIAKHDPELALTVLKETFPAVVAATQEPDGAVPEPITRQEHELELRLARKIGPRNADVAVQFARQSLEKGFSDDLVLLLIRLNSKNREQAQSLYRDIVRKLREADFRDSRQKNQYEYPELSLATKLVEHFTPPAADEATYRELVNVLLTKAIAEGCDRVRSENGMYQSRVNLCGYFGRLVPLMEKFYPAQARQLRHWAPEGGEFRPDTLTQSYEELNYLSVNGTIDEILALSSRYPALSDEILMRAISRAENDGDLERAQKIASTYRGEDPDFQRRLSERAEFYNLSEARLEQEWARAEKNLVRLSPSDRAESLLSAASVVALINKKFALKILDQASGLADAFTPGEKQTKFQVRLALTYCLAKDDRGFAMMESLLPKLNELVGAAAKLDGFDTRYLREGEWNMSAAGSTG